MKEMEDVLRGMTFEFFGRGSHKVTVEKLMEAGGVLLDVRAAEEVAAVRLGLEGLLEVLHVPTCEIPDRLGEIPRDRPVGAFCSAGTRSAVVYAYLRAKGFENARVVAGGYDCILPLVKPGKLLKRLEARP